MVKIYQTVKVRSGRGNVSGSGTTDVTGPTTPTLTATATGATSISLSWTASTDPSGVSGYQLYRSTDNATWGSPIYTGAVRLVSNPYIDTVRTAATPYYYQVRAYDPYSNYSGYGQANATTQAAATGTLIKTTDFELASPWPPSGWAYSVASPGVNPSRSTTHARNGTASMRAYAGVSASISRSEFTSQYTGNNMEFFRDHWLGYSVFLPSAYFGTGSNRVSTTYMLFGQIHSRSAGWSAATGVPGNTQSQPMISLHVSYNAKAPANYWYIPTVGKGDYHIGAIDADLDEWTDWVFHFRWNNLPEGTGTNVSGNSACGMAEVYKNGTLVLSIPGPWCNDDPALNNSPGSGWGPAWKMGIYAGALNFDREVFIDDFKHAIDGSYALVAPTGDRTAGF